MTPTELREAVALAILASDRRAIGFPMVASLDEMRPCDQERYRDEAASAIRIVLDAAVAVCRECAEKYRAEADSSQATSAIAIAYAGGLGGANEIADAIASLRSDSALRPESGEGER